MDRRHFLYGAAIGGIGLLLNSCGVNVKPIELPNRRELANKLSANVSQEFLKTLESYKHFFVFDDKQLFVHNFEERLVGTRGMYSKRAQGYAVFYPCQTEGSLIKLVESPILLIAVDPVPLGYTSTGLIDDDLDGIVDRYFTDPTGPTTNISDLDASERSSFQNRYESGIQELITSMRKVGARHSIFPS